MMNRWGFPFFIVLLLAVPAGRAQSSTPHSAKDDYSQEAAVIEELSTKIAFENDGKFTHEQTSRIRVQTDAGVQQWGLLNFPFQSATQTVEIDYVRVRKPDGSDKMKFQGKQLHSIDLNFPAPTDFPARFVRRGILGCYQYSGCSFVLLDSQSVNSLN
jgi:hypothetical protein